jgi:hypothetical protein
MTSKKEITKRRKKTVERKFEVHAEIENFTLAKGKSALKLQIYSRNEKRGELQIGRGSIRWWSATARLSTAFPGRASPG